MEEPSLRIRIVFDDRKLLSKSMRREGLTQSWFLLTPDMATMADVASHLVDKFGLRRSEIQLTMDDFVLPPFESTCILKSHDILKVREKGAAQKKATEAGKFHEEDEEDLCPENENPDRSLTISSENTNSKKKRKNPDIAPKAKRKKYKQISSKKPLAAAEESVDVTGEQNQSCFHEGESSKKKSSKKHRKSNELDSCAEPNSTLDNRIVELPSSVPANERNDEPDETILCSPHAMDNSKQDVPSEQQMNGSHHVSSQQEDGILIKGATSSKGQKWGAENITGNGNNDGSYKLNFKVNNVGEGSNINEKSINDGWRSSTNFTAGGWKNTGKSIAGGWKNSKDGIGGGWKSNGNSSGGGWKNEGNFTAEKGNSNAGGWDSKVNCTANEWNINRNSTAEGWKTSGNSSVDDGWKVNGSNAQGWKCSGQSAAAGNWKNSRNSTGQGWKNNSNSANEGWKPNGNATDEGWKCNANSNAGGWKNNINSNAGEWRNNGTGKNNEVCTGEGWISTRNATGGSAGNDISEGLQNAGNDDGEGCKSKDIGVGWKSNGNTSTEGWKSSGTPDEGFLTKNVPIGDDEDRNVNMIPITEGTKDEGSNLNMGSEGTKDKGKSVIQDDTVDAGIDFQNLFPLTCLPQVGDLLVYRCVELSATGCPVISPFRVGKVSSYDPATLKIILVPVPEYPFALPKYTEGEESMNRTYLKAYKEDGSLEVLYPSLVDVRLLKAKSDSSEVISGREVVTAEVAAPKITTQVTTTGANSMSNWDRALSNEVTKQVDTPMVATPIAKESESCWGQTKQITSERAQMDNNGGWDEWAPNRSSTFRGRGGAGRSNYAFPRGRGRGRGREKGRGRGRNSSCAFGEM